MLELRIFFVPAETCPSIRQFIYRSPIPKRGCVRKRRSFQRSHQWTEKSLFKFIISSVKGVVCFRWEITNSKFQQEEIKHANTNCLTKPF